MGNELSVFTEKELEDYQVNSIHFSVGKRSHVYVC